MSTGEIRSAGERLPTLTGMRWLAALSVFVYHAVWETFPAELFGETGGRLASNLGWVGVSFFFVLSGFVLAWSAKPGDTVRRFWRRRLLKIYPNHLVTLTAALLLALWAGAQVTGVLPGALLIQSWWHDPSISMGGNPVSWSISCELVFYATFPLWRRLIARIAPEHLWYWAAGLAAVVICLPFAAGLLPERPYLPWAPNPAWQFWFVYVFPLTRMMEFVLGVLMARIVREGRWAGPGLVGATAALAVGYAISLYVPVLFVFAAATVVPLALLIAAGATADIRGTRSPLRGRVMVRLGEISFAFYLWHHMVLTRITGAFGTDGWSTAAATAVVALSLLVTLLLAWLLHRLVEEPVMRRFGSPARKERTPPAGGGGPKAAPRDGGRAERESALPHGG
ncbi:acyltransferase family protein [Streptomyces sp. NPDC017448]|uniref:acyltransferase family protein n=1 Tax=Streptomyces sp. NPDC017448 TaxID=3364996 RepID=UPI0037A05AE3